MTVPTSGRAALPLAIALLLGACGGGEATGESGAAQPGPVPEAGHEDEGRILLDADRIAAAGIGLGRPSRGGAGTIELPAIVEGDPQGMQVVSAAIGGRVASLTRNLGQPIRRGDVLAVIESREAAALNAEIEAARARLALARSNLAREERLFAQRVSPEQDVIAARTAAAEARIALELARRQVGAAGVGGGRLDRIAITAPISGQVISRGAVPGQMVAADAELYRIADLATLSLSFNLRPADAGRVRPGAGVTIRAAGREAPGRVAFVSPALDPQTRLVPAIATLDNRSGLWWLGEPVTVAVTLAGGGGDMIRVPAAAVQTIGGRSAVFVRTPTGFEVRPVVLGDGSGGDVIVRQGLEGREVIATTNSFTLKAELGKGEAAHED